MPDFIGALDQGTTSTRFMVFDHSGTVVASHQLAHRQIHPRPGWVEHDPVEIWRNTESCIQVAMASAKLKPTDLAAVGVTNQRETTLVWDPQTGQPYANAIVWQDTRTDEICRQLARKGGKNRFRGKTGLPLATYFSGPKLRWLLQSIDGLRQQAEAGRAIFGTMDSWLIWQLTGGPAGGLHLTDVSNASRTLLMNLETLSWDEELLAAMAVPASMLPAIRPSIEPELFGLSIPDGPLAGEVPLCGVLGDQQAALYGQVCFEAGEAKNTYGTGCFLLLNTGKDMVVSRHGLVTTVAYQVGEHAPNYALEGSIAMAGALVGWLEQNLGIIDGVEEVEGLARMVEDNGGCYFVPAFSGLFAPHWRDDARGVIAGLTHYISKGHIARAALEATAFQTWDVIQAMQADAAVQLGSLKVDGGMVKNELLMQFQADILDVPIVRPAVQETTALGAAYAAGRAINYWEDHQALKANWQEKRSWRPDMPSSQREYLLQGWQKAIQRSLDWLD